MTLRKIYKRTRVIPIMTRQEKFDVTITNDFTDTWSQFLEVISTDKEYNILIKKKEDSDKRFQKKDNKCAKVRYVIGYYLKNKKLEIIKNKQKEMKK